MDKMEMLMAQCSAHAACAKGMRDLRKDLSTQDIMKLFFKYSDFCFAYDTPSLDLIRRWKGSCEEYGVFVDEEVDAKNTNEIMLNGQCKGTLEYDGYAVARVYLRHGSKAALNATDHAYVTVDVMDNSYLVVAVAGNDAQVIVNKYGDAQVECIGTGIKVINKND